MDNSLSPILCSTCRGFIDCPNELVGAAFTTSYTNDTITQSAKQGCILCSWVLIWASKSKTLDNITATIRNGEYYFEENMKWREECKAMRLEYRSENNRSFSILLRLALSEGDQAHVKLIPTHDLHKRSLAKVHGTALSSTTRDESCFLRTKDWLHTCFHEHKLCHRQLEQESPTMLPSRLIEIESGKSARVVMTKDLNSSRLHYATLSHRWNAQRMPKLLHSNIDSWTKKINVHEMPPVFQHAIEVASQWIGLRYIWIDALCIVQDDVEDWAREAALMGRVYAHAYCNLAGYASADRGPDTGLFLDRVPGRVSFVPLTIRRRNLDQTFYGYPSDESDIWSSSSLLSRGWVLQERLLSPRTIYFGERLEWECSELKACELYPQGGPTPNSVTPWGKVGVPFRATNMLHDDYRYQGALGLWTMSLAKSVTDVRSGELHRKWLYIMECFSRCELTYQDDCFPALSGLAYYFQKALDDRYVAGIWRKNLVPGLLWWHFSTSEKTVLSGYRAPTWSWASSNAAVYYPLIHDIHCANIDDVWVATVVKISMQLSTEDPFGSVANGHIRLSGCLRTSGSSLGELLNRRCSNNDQPYQYYLDKRADTHLTEEKNEAHLLLLTYRVKYLSDSVRELKELRGLILERVSDDPNQYRRCGFFHHAWLQDRDDRTGRYPPFIDFDPRNFDRTVVTII